MQKKVLIFIVAHNAQRTILQVLERIPKEIFSSKQFTTDILIIDDSSQDDTFKKALTYKDTHPELHINILDNPENLGYGGNQKLGYHYAIKHKYDIVSLIHGDGKYAPESLPQLLKPLLADKADMVLGSRMMKSFQAIREGMPVFKYLGNRLLTGLQNLILNKKLSEYHSGYRLYKVNSLRTIPFEHNSNDYDVDTDIIIQFFMAGYTIRELPIPTYYGDELTYRNGFLYSLKILATTLRYKIMHFGIFYHPKFDHLLIDRPETRENLYYTSKFGYSSSHQLAYDFIKEKDTVLDLGCGPGFMEEKLKEKKCTTIAVDQYITKHTRKLASHSLACDLNDFSSTTVKQEFNKVLVLDIIEHLDDPEKFLFQLREISSKFNASVLITTGNINFFIVRFMHLFGFFNYGREGILDRTHTRLFTFNTLKKAIKTAGFTIQKTKGIPAPFPKAFGDNFIAKILLLANNILITLHKNLFSYQIAYIIHPLPSLPLLLKKAGAKARSSSREIRKKSK